MSAGKKFAKGQYFAWGDTLYMAVEECEVWPGVISGDTEEICRFDMECDPEVATKMIEVIGGDPRYLMIGSDSGMDDEADDEEEPTNSL